MMGLGAWSHPVVDVSAIPTNSNKKINKLKNYQNFNEEKFFFFWN
jgi:hypothetical protein